MSYVCLLSFVLCGVYACMCVQGVCNVCVLYEVYMLYLYVRSVYCVLGLCTRRVDQMNRASVSCFGKLQDFAPSSIQTNDSKLLD